MDHLETQATSDTRHRTKAYTIEIENTTQKTYVKLLFDFKIEIMFANVEYC